MDRIYKQSSVEYEMDFNDLSFEDDIILIFKKMIAKKFYSYILYLVLNDKIDSNFRFIRKEIIFHKISKTKYKIICPDDAIQSLFKLQSKIRELDTINSRFSINREQFGDDDVFQEFTTKEFTEGFVEFELTKWKLVNMLFMAEIVDFQYQHDFKKVMNIKFINKNDINFDKYYNV